MEIKIENILELLELDSETLVRGRKIRIFPLSDPPERDRFLYPIVDRTLGIGFFLDGAHRFFTSRLGSLLAKKEINLYSEDDDDIDFFLKNHGYYWSSTVRSGILITSKHFQFDSLDRTLALKWELSKVDKDYPFD